MNGMKPKHLKKILSTLFISLLLLLPILAESDPDPNSPTPVLLSAPDSTRALASSETDKSARDGLPRTHDLALDLNSRVLLYVTNVQLMNGEAATAFRVYAQDARNRFYRFPVLAIRLIDKQKRIYALTVELRDELDFWEEPPANGDLLISVAWRGLESNRVRLGFGQTSEAVKDEGRAVPATPPASRATHETDLANSVGYRWSGDRTRFMEQTTFGPSPALDLRLRRIGLRTWLAEQFDMPYPSSVAPYPTFPLKPSNPPPDCNGLIDNQLPDPDPFCYVNHYSMYPVQNWFYREAFYGDAQLRHRVAWALAQLWVISGNAGETQQSSHMVAYHKVLSRNAF